jgi:hypothetical protein
VEAYLELARGDIRRDLQKLILAHQVGGEWPFKITDLNQRRFNVFRLVWTGFSGAPVLDSLQNIIPEIEKASEQQLDGFLQILPIRCLLVIMTLNFPALLMLIFDLLVRQLTDGGLL